MPYDGFSVATIAVSALLLAASWRLSGHVSRRIALILLAGFLIRADAACQWSLHRWDESYHALVAKNLIADPLKPVLYRAPALPYDLREWTANHVWLHKPPGALWLMAGSMAMFGVNEVALRAPSVLLSTLAVLLTFLIGRALFSDGVGLLAAGFHAVNGFLVVLAAGRRVADHVDTALIFWVELAILGVVFFVQRRRTGWLLLGGAALGIAFLVKSFPALVVMPVAMAAFRPLGLREGFRAALIMVAMAVAVAAPWTLFAWTAYRGEAAWSTRYTFMHMTQIVEGQATPRWTYFADMPRFFGELIAIPIGVVVLKLARGTREQALRILAMWMAVPYLVFTLMATRLPAYVMIAAPALFLMQAYVWTLIRDRVRDSRGAVRVAAVVLLVLLALLPARYLLEPSGAFEKRDRAPRETEHMRAFEERLKLPAAVLFNVPRPIEAMFYSPYTAYERMPTVEEVRALRSRGMPVVIYQREHEAPVPADWDVVVLSESEVTRR